MSVRFWWDSLWCSIECTNLWRRAITFIVAITLHNYRMQLDKLPINAIARANQADNCVYVYYVTRRLGQKWKYFFVLRFRHMFEFSQWTRFSTIVSHSGLTWIPLSSHAIFCRMCSSCFDFFFVLLYICYSKSFVCPSTKLHWHAVGSIQSLN